MKKTSKKEKDEKKEIGSGILETYLRKKMEKKIIKIDVRMSSNYLDAANKIYIKK